MIKIVNIKTDRFLNFIAFSLQKGGNYPKNLYLSDSWIGIGLGAIHLLSIDKIQIKEVFKYEGF